MKKILSLGLLLILLTISCKDDPVQEATLRVVNQTSCSYNINGGEIVIGTQSTEYVGTVAPNETKEFTISTNINAAQHDGYQATPNNCASGQIHSYSFYVSAGETKQILID